MLRLTREQVREVDRWSIEEYHIPGVVLMENASRAAADVAWEMVGRRKDAKVLIVCGGGNNGGDGLAAARHLSNRGVDVTIALTIDPAKYSGDALINWRIVEAMKLPWGRFERAKEGYRCDLILDAIFGTGLRERPREPFGEIVAAMQSIGAPILAIDVPSGLDCDTGEPLGPRVRATRTITFVAEKAGFANPKATEYLGEVVVGDIGCPRKLVEAIAK